VLKVENPEAALQALHRADWGAHARLENGSVVTRSPSGRGRELISYLENAGCTPDTVAERHQSLEEIFLSLTEGVQ
jgi:hypothetical protein